MTIQLSKNTAVPQDLPITQDTDTSRLQTLLAQSPAVIYTSHASKDYGTTFISDNIRDLLGYEPSDFIEDSGFWGDKIHPEDRARVFECLPDLFQEGSHVQEYRFRHKNGTYQWLRDECRLMKSQNGESVEIVGSWTDISEHKKMENCLNDKHAHFQYLTYHDLLTGLPNRDLFQDRLCRALMRADRSKRQVAVFFIDLDQFKKVNDTLGHQTGDQLLQEVAKRLQTRVRKVDTLARFGGDEFAIVIENLSGVEPVARIAQNFLGVLETPFSIGDHLCYVSASIGISLYSSGAGDLESLQKQADIAMYAAKDRGRNNFQFYSPEMDSQAHELLLLENDLRQALEQEQLVLHYQPQVDLTLGRIVGLEALVRWNHPDRGMVSPGNFIPLAEETGLILTIGTWILRTACAYARRLQDLGGAPLRMSVNISMLQLRAQGFTELVSRTLKETGLKPEWLELEITESAAMENASETIARLATLKKMGVRVSIDDFGTGHSSLSHVKYLSITGLKIDKNFVADIQTDRYDLAIVEAIQTLAKSLNLEVVAEGIETQEQKQLLCQLGCTLGQGFLFSHPLPPDEILSLCQLEHPFDELF